MTPRSPLSPLVAWLVAAVVTVGSAASAQAQFERVVVGDVEGPGAAPLRAALADALGDVPGWSVVPDAEVARMASRLQIPRDAPEVASALDALVVVEGDVRRAGRQQVLDLRVIEASSGATLAAEQFSASSAGALRTSVRRGAGERLRAALEASVSRRDAAEAAAAVPVPAPVVENPRQVARPVALVLHAGARVFSRELTYTDDVFAALRPYTLPAGVALGASARWYPGAHVTDDALAHVGLDLAFDAALGLRSRQRDGTTYPTDALQGRAGIDVRLPLAPAELGLGFGAGLQTFTLGPSDAGLEAPIPDVESVFLRPAVRLAVALPLGFAIEASFGWRILLSTGAFGGASWFPRSSGMGLDGGAWLGWVSDLGVGIRAGAQIQRHFFSLNPSPGDPLVAGGAVDQSIQGDLDLVVHLR